MRKFLPYILILIILIGIFNPTIRIIAADPYVLLAPLPNMGPTFDPTQTNNLGIYLNLMIKLFIGICAVLAVIMIVMGGIQYMTSELISNKEEGKKRITQAIFGLLLALGAWLILSTINPDILKTDLSSLKDVTVAVALNDSVAQTPTMVNGKLQYTSGGLNYTKDEIWAPRAGQLADLTNSGATVDNECSKVGQTNCTSTRGLNPNTLNTIHQQCLNCELKITGGTEFWAHGGETGSTSHQIGSPTVDLRPNPALNAYLSGGKPLVPMTRYPSPNGPYLYEGNHWHIGP